MSHRHHTYTGVYSVHATFGRTKRHHPVPAPAGSGGRSPRKHPQSNRYHLAAPERASVVLSNISPGARGRFTPFYGLAPGKTGAES